MCSLTFVTFKFHLIKSRVRYDYREKVSSENLPFSSALQKFFSSLLIILSTLTFGYKKHTTENCTSLLMLAFHFLLTLFSQFVFAYTTWTPKIIKSSTCFLFSNVWVCVWKYNSYKLWGVYNDNNNNNKKWITEIHIAMWSNDALHHLFSLFLFLWKGSNNIHSFYVDLFLLCVAIINIHWKLPVIIFFSVSWTYFKYYFLLLFHTFKCISHHLSGGHIAYLGNLKVPKVSSILHPPPQ